MKDTHLRARFGYRNHREDLLAGQGLGRPIPLLGCPPAVNPERNLAPAPQSVFPSRSRPAAASKTASPCPSASLRSRVSTFPRNSTASMSGRSALSCALRRWLLVPTL